MDAFGAMRCWDILSRLHTITRAPCLFRFSDPGECVMKLCSQCSLGPLKRNAINHKGKGNSRFAFGCVARR